MSKARQAEIDASRPGPSPSDGISIAGVAGLHFIEAVLASSAAQGAYQEIGAG